MQELVRLQRARVGIDEALKLPSAQPSALDKLRLQFVLQVFGHHLEARRKLVRAQAG